MQDNMKASRPEQACWHLDIYSLVATFQAQSNVSQHAFKGRQGTTLCRSDALVWGIPIKAWGARKWGKNLKKLQLAALGLSFKERIKACWKYSQPCGGIFIVMLQQLVLGYSSDPVSDRLLLLHSSSAHRLIMRMYLARPKARLITINRVQGKASFCTGSIRKGILNCTKCQEHRIKKQKGVAYTNKPRVDTQVEQLQLVAA